MKRIHLIVAASITVGPLVSLPAVAAAGPDNCYEIPGNVSLYNTEGFYADLERQGIQSEETSEIRSTTLNLGCAICNAYADTRSNDEVGEMLIHNGDSIHDAAAWKSRRSITCARSTKPF